VNWNSNQAKKVKLPPEEFINASNPSEELSNVFFKEIIGSKVKATAGLYGKEIFEQEKVSLELVGTPSTKKKKSK